MAWGATGGSGVHPNIYNTPFNGTAKPTPAAAPAPVAAPAATPQWTPPAATPGYTAPTIAAIPDWGGPAPAATTADTRSRHWGGGWNMSPGGVQQGNAGWTPPAATTEGTAAVATPMDQTARLQAMQQRFSQAQPNNSLMGGAGWNPAMGDATMQQMRGARQPRGWAGGGMMGMMNGGTGAAGLGSYATGLGNSLMG